MSAKICALMLFALDLRANEQVVCGMAGHPRRRQRNPREKLYGRLTLIGLFIFLNIGQVLTLMSDSPALKDPETRMEIMGQCVVEEIWTVFLFGAIWVGQNWARYLVIAFVAYSLVRMIPDISAVFYHNLQMPFGFWVVLVYYLALVPILIYSPHIRALVRK